jgi:tetratricopeptide (TPR) repeat protein
MTRGRRLVVALSCLAALGAGCSGSKGGAAGDKPAAAASGGASGGEVAEAKGLLAAGRIDDALLRLQQSQAPEALYLQGEAWAKKAETAPLPTPEALPAGSPRGVEPATPEFKPEELTAAGYYEKAIAALGDDPRPHAGLARLLAPHAQRRYEAEQAALARKPVKGKPTATLPPTPGGLDYSPARVAREWHVAAAAKASTAEDLEALYVFASHAGLLDEADWALRERIRRENENPDHLIRYGDFLRELKKDPEAAQEQYRQALIWRPDDKVAKARLADIFIDMGVEHYQRSEYATAEARFQDAAKWITDRSSEQSKRLEREMERLKRLRGN